MSKKLNKKYIDLSHTIKHGEITYKGLPAPLICDFLSREASASYYEKGTTFQIGKIEMVGNTGTYIDCPFHRYEDGNDLSDLSIEQVANLEGVIIYAPFEKGLEVTKQLFEGIKLKHKAVLIHTGWSKHWQSDAYFENHPYVSEEAAVYLKKQEVALVGIDSHNIDNTNKNSRPVHSVLLKHNILIVEHLTNLHLLIDKEFTFSAVPPKVEAFGTFPVRAFASLKT